MAVGSVDATRSPPDALMSVIRTWLPSDAKRVAIEAPKPEPPPVFLRG